MSWLALVSLLEPHEIPYERRAYRRKVLRQDASTSGGGVARPSKDAPVASSVEVDDALAVHAELKGGRPRHGWREALLNRS